MAHEMFETAAILIPFLIADVIDPVLFAFLVYAARDQPPDHQQQRAARGPHGRLFCGGCPGGPGPGEDHRLPREPNR